MVRLSFILALFATTVASAPIYQPAFHGPLPGHEHEFNLQHVRHVDENGKVTYIHDTRDHRPDFCAMPGEDELCRQQIEAANNAPAVYDDDTIILTTPHKDDELAPGNDGVAHETPSLDVPQQTSDVHAADTTITLDNGNVITIHNDNGHVRNINDGAINMEGPPAEGGHVPNINTHPQSMHREIIKEDIPDLITLPHQRNINDNPALVDGPAQDGGHVPNINTHPQSMHRETIKEEIIPDLVTVPHQRNINDNPAPVDGPAQDGGHVPNINPHPQSMHRETIKEEIIPDPVTVPHQRNINDNPQVGGPPSEVGHFPNINPQQGQSVSEKTSAETPNDVPQSPFPGAFGPHTIASHPINKLQEAIRKTQA